PKWVFENAREDFTEKFKKYIFGSTLLGELKEDGAIQFKGLKENYKLFYTHEKGLSIEKPGRKGGYDELGD
ncbi:MAG TPA: hypothetical protein DHW82_13070, partial [Spirochaetia bacterium]|nr:hypothetical protein [Spirochaetia bacterium]